jgi:hypothetical protein
MFMRLILPRKHHGDARTSVVIRPANGFELNERRGPVAVVIANMKLKQNDIPGVATASRVVLQEEEIPMSAGFILSFHSGGDFSVAIPDGTSHGDRNLETGFLSGIASAGRVVKHEEDGMNQTITLATHQRDAVWRIMSGGNTLLAHAVGAGKTFVMSAAGMKLKQAGLIDYVKLFFRHLSDGIRQSRFEAASARAFRRNPLRQIVRQLARSLREDRPKKLPKFKLTARSILVVDEAAMRKRLQRTGTSIQGHQTISAHTKNCSKFLNHFPNRLKSTRQRVRLMALRKDEFSSLSKLTMKSLT